MALFETLGDDVLRYIFFVLCNPVRPKDALPFVCSYRRVWKTVKTDVRRLRKASYIATSLLKVSAMDDGVCCDQVTRKQAVAISKQLLRYTTIRRLYIGCFKNHDGPYPMVKGARAIARSLEANSALTTLHLIGQKCGTLGVIALSKALHQNRALTHLNLSYNGEIGSQAGIALGLMLAVNETLSVLNLRQSRIYAEGAVAIASALTTNKTLRNLNMDKSFIRREGRTAVCEAWKMHERCCISLQTFPGEEFLS